jgi:uncharacterized protein YcaQ
MERFPNNQWEKQLWEKHHALAKPILERIRTEGPLSARHFEDTREVIIAKGWGDWKPAKVMLELLMWRGDLIVTARDRFQRVYDLTERVIPDRKDAHKPDEAARAKFMVLRTLLAHGIATEYDIKNHLFLADKKAVPLALQTLCTQGKIHPLKVTDNKETYYCLSESQLQTALESPIPERVYLLSPFDNAVILRKRLSQLFAFDYTIECYVPAAKRLYGYWTMPVLYRNEFVGRIDPKADRKTKTLLINSLFVQSSTWRDPAFQTAFAQEMNSFMLFNGCETVVLPKPVLV